MRVSTARFWYNPRRGASRNDADPLLAAAAAARFSTASATRSMVVCRANVVSLPRLYFLLFFPWPIGRRTRADGPGATSLPKEAFVGLRGKPWLVFVVSSAVQPGEASAIQVKPSFPPHPHPRRTPLHTPLDTMLARLATRGGPALPKPVSEGAKAMGVHATQPRPVAHLARHPLHTRQAFQASTLPRLASPSLVSRRGLASSADPYDVIIVGGGPGGYVAAIKSGQLGLKTAIVESRGSLGGTCLNVGCIPSKAMLNTSHMYHQAKHDFKSRGIDVKDLSLNLATMLKAKDKSVTALTKGVEGLMKKNKVDYVKGFGSFASPTTINVKLNDGGETQLEAKNIIIATGSEVAPFPGIELDEKQVVSSTGALELQKVPEKMVVIGAGIIGLEMGSIWSRLGAQVSVVEFQNAIGGIGMDGEVCKAFKKILEKQGLSFKMGTKVLGAEKRDGKVFLQVEDAKTGDKQELDADVVLVAIGRRPRTEGLNLEAVGIEKDEKGRVVVDDQYNTTCKGVKCIGDATFGPMLAHKAEEEGIAAIEIIKHGHGHVNYGAIPSVVYTHPEVAWVGKSEEDLKREGVEYRTGSFPFIANSRAKTNSDTDGFVKFIVEKETDKILGVHLIGPAVGEQVSAAVLAVEYAASAEDVGRTCFAHPTLSEAFKEAAMAAYSKPIHF